MTIKRFLFLIGFAFFLASPVFGGDSRTGHYDSLRLQNGAFYTELKSGTLTGSRQLIFPDSNGTSGYVLSTNGSGTLSWINGGAAGASIGSAVGGGTAGSVLFVGAGPVLAQNNAKFFWDNTADRLGINTTTPAIDLEVAGALRLSGTNVDTFLTPIGSNANTKINIPIFNPGAFSEVMAMGIPSTATTTSRVIGLYDARSVPHQPTLLTFSPDENQALGFSWDGQDVTAYLKSSKDLAFMVNGLTTGTEAMHISHINGFIGIDSQFPTSPVTLSKVSTEAGGIVFNMVTDEVTDYQRFRFHESGDNIMRMEGESGGAGVPPDWSVAGNGNRIYSNGSAGFFQLLAANVTAPILKTSFKPFIIQADSGPLTNTATVTLDNQSSTGPTSGVTPMVDILGTMSSVTGSADYIGLRVKPTINMNTVGPANATGNSTGLLVQPTFTATGIGSTNYIARFGNSSVPNSVVIKDDGTVAIGVGAALMQALLDTEETYSSNKPVLRVKNKANGVGVVGAVVDVETSDAASSPMIWETLGSQIARIQADGKLILGGVSDTLTNWYKSATGILKTDGAVFIAGTGGNVPHECVTRSASVGTTTSSCSGGEIATGGGVDCGNTALYTTQSIPVGSNPPTGWTGSCVTNTSILVVVVCCQY